MHMNDCTICGTPIFANQTKYGDGDGTGSSFAHSECYRTRLLSVADDSDKRWATAQDLAIVIMRLAKK